jgi:hypothetical protein
MLAGIPAKENMVSHSKIVAYLIISIGFAVAVGWLLEAAFVGRGFISTYLAPIAFLAPSVGAVLLQVSGRRPNA